MGRNRTVEEIRESQLLELKDLANEAHEWRDKHARKWERRLWVFYPLAFFIFAVVVGYAEDYCAGRPCGGFQEAGRVIDVALGIRLSPEAAARTYNYNFDSLPETAPPAETTYDF